MADGWRGVLATQVLESGDCLLSVPETLLMTGRSARRDPLLNATLVQHPQLSPYQVRDTPRAAPSARTK